MGRGNRTLETAILGVLCLAFVSPAAAHTENSPRAASPGCGREAPADPPAVVQANGEPRALIAVVPEDYRADRPHQLVLGFHGRTSPNETVRRYFDLERHATRPTIFVYPAGSASEDGAFSWSDPGDPSDALRDYALFDAVIATFGSKYCIDADRVFAVGHSLGASFVNSLGCARGDVLRAIATLAGGVSPSECQGRTAALILHNPNDRLVAFEFGEAVRDHYVAENQADEASNGELDGPRALVQAPGFVCRHYDAGGGEHPVLWCPHTQDRSRSGRYYPHHWPSGTGALIMSFFEGLPDPGDGLVDAHAQAQPGSG